MLNFDTKPNLHVIPMPISQDYHILASHTEHLTGGHLIVMTYLTDEEEKDLDNGEKLLLKRGKERFNVHANNIFCYGDVDFNKGSEDLEQIATFNFLDYLNGVGIKTPSDYDYDTHSCYSPIRFYRITETWNPAVLARYAHATLNKPKKIVLFRKLL